MSGMFGYRAQIIRGLRQQVSDVTLDALLSRLRFDVEVGAIPQDSVEIEALLSQLRFDLEVSPVVTDVDFESLLSRLQFDVQVTVPTVDNPVTGWIARWEARYGYVVNDPTPPAVRWYAANASNAPILTTYLNQDIGSLVPTYNATGINGQPALAFSGDSIWSLDTPLNTAIGTLFVVMKADGNFSGFDGVVEWLGTGVGGSSNTNGGFTGIGGTPNIWTSTAATLDLFQIDGVNQNLTNARNFSVGVSLGNITDTHLVTIRNSADAVGNKEIWVGRRAQPFTGSFAGSVAAIYLYPVGMLDADIATQTAYLRGVFGFA